MTEPCDAKSGQSLSLEALAKDLATFAIDRTDLKELLAALPEDSQAAHTAVEYELALLKILTVGWAISFYMAPEDPNKAPLAEQYWQNIQEVADQITALTNTTSGTQIDYFNIIRERLDTYVKVLSNQGEGVDNPAAIMGPAFAVACNCPSDAAAVLTGTKMFALTLGAVREYLNAVTIEGPRLN